jgi:hypothetical protein
MQLSGGDRHHRHSSAPIEYKDIYHTDPSTALVLSAKGRSEVSLCHVALCCVGAPEWSTYGMDRHTPRHRGLRNNNPSLEATISSNRHVVLIAGMQYAVHVLHAARANAAARAPAALIARCMTAVSVTNANERCSSGGWLAAAAAAAAAATGLLVATPTSHADAQSSTDAAQPRGAAADDEEERLHRFSSWMAANGADWSAVRITRCKVTMMTKKCPQQ